MITTFDHVIVLAADIERAATNFREAGFTVVHREDEGGHFADHRLVCFADGSYLELFTFHRDDEAARQHRWFRYDELGEGFCDYSVSTDDLAELVAAAEAAGVPHTPIAEGGKNRLDGQKWALKVSMFGLGVAGPELPFVLQDLTPREIRVNGSTAHENGASHIRSVTIVTPETDSARRALAVLTGCETPVTADHMDGDLTTYAFGDREICLLVPRAGTPAAQRLAEAGPVVYEITMATNTGTSRLLDPSALHHARIVLA